VEKEMFNWVRRLFKRKSKLIGWACGINKPQDRFEIVRYSGRTWGPACADGADRDGDFWCKERHCRGKPGRQFEWCDPPEPHQYIPSQIVLQVLVENGKITEEDIQAARTAAKLLNRTNL
jgi:hypothetical protein